MECKALGMLAFKLAILFLIDITWKGIDFKGQKNELMSSRLTAIGDGSSG
jgi:hypothetical protein